MPLAVIYGIEMNRLKKIKTLIVDDSVTIRKVIQHLLFHDPRFEVAEEAANPEEAMKIITTKDIDLVTMDLHLPRKSGSDLVYEYMLVKPIPTVIISSLSSDESDLVLQALENGAVDYIQKPSRDTLLTMRTEILERLYQASQVKKETLRQKLKAKVNLKNAEKCLLVIGASTGGTEAIKSVLKQLGPEIPPTLIVQHIPPHFSKAFAERLNRTFPFEVREARSGDIIKKNLVLIAPGGMQMRLARAGNNFVTIVEDAPPVNRHKPSVDFLFDSVSKEYPDPKIGLLLTGMGADGAEGLLRLNKAGAYTIAQDEASSIVFGMPKEAIKRGAATEVCGLQQMGLGIEKALNHLFNQTP